MVAEQHTKDSVVPEAETCCNLKTGVQSRRIFFFWFSSHLNIICFKLFCICSLQIIRHVRDTAQVTEPFLKATLSPSAVAVQRCVEKSSMTPGCPFHLGQKIHPFQEQGKHNTKSTYLGKLVFQSKDYSTTFECMYCSQVSSLLSGISKTLLNTTHVILRRL